MMHLIVWMLNDFVINKKDNLISMFLLLRDRPNLTFNFEVNKILKKKMKRLPLSKIKDIFNKDPCFI